MTDAEQIVYLNGNFLPVADAHVSVLDRGFIYGDGVYELVPLYGREPFRLPQHLARLQRSLDGIGLANPHTAAQWEALIRDLAARQPFADQGVYFQVTRGAAKRDHAFPKGVPPTVFMMSNPLPTPTREQVERGVAVVTAEDNRWHRCDLKTISLLGNVLLRQLAAEQGAAETVLFRDGFLSEASASNVLIVKDGTIIVPPKDNLILPGHHLRRDDGVRARSRRSAGCASGAEGGGARRRRDVAVLVDERGARDHDRRRQALRRRETGPRVSQGVGSLPGEKAAHARARMTRRSWTSSFPRKRGNPVSFDGSRWVPAFAGTTGLLRDQPSGSGSVVPKWP